MTRPSYLATVLLSVVLACSSRAATFVVTNTLDYGPGSLVELIGQANATPGPDVIRFDLQPPGPHTIYMADPFADITDPLTLDGTTQPGFAGAPLIEIDSGSGWWHGLVVASSNCVIRGLAIVHAGADGIRVEAAGHGAVIGGTNGAGNRLTRNGGNGVTVAGATNVSVRGNAVFANGGLGIDLEGDGVTANDNDDPDDGANHAQNFPVLDSATLSASGIAISGSLNSRRQTTFQIDFYDNVQCDASGHGEGEFYLGSTSLTTGNGGDRNFNVTLPTPALGFYITATATDPAGNTSEHSRCVRAASSIAPATFTVTNTLDAGAGSLRHAILQANARLASGPNTIAFNIPGPGVHSLLPLSALPKLTTPVVIDGYTQPGTSTNTRSNGFNAVLRVRLDGRALPGEEAGLVLRGGGSTVRGLMVVNFPWEGVWFDGAGSNVLTGNLIGLDGAGLPQPNGRNAGSGVLFCQTTNGVVGGTSPAARNIISGNAGAGLCLDGAARALVTGNFIGTDLSGSNAVPNGTGVILSSCDGAVVGGLTTGTRNVISGNLGSGISVVVLDESCRVQGNSVGVDVSGLGPLGNFDGIYASVIGGGTVTVGGTNAGSGNTIAFNDARGVIVASQHVPVRRNAIFDNGGLGLDLNADGPTPNDGNGLVPDAPEFMAVVTSPARTTVRGAFTEAPETVFALEFFDNPECDPTGFGEGRTYLGTTNVLTDVAGHAVFTWTLPAPLTAGRVLTATSTDPYGNTSEFSACAPVVPYNSADLRVEAAVSGDPVSLASNFTYTVIVQNYGPTNATGVTLSNVLPAHVTFVNATASQGSCVHVAGRVTCALGALPVGGTATLTLTVQPTLGGGASLACSVRGSELDPLPENDSFDLSSPTVGLSDLSVRWIVDPPVLPSGVPGSMRLVVSNAGPDRADGVAVSVQVPPFSWYLLTAEASQGTASLAGFSAEAFLGALLPSQSATVTVGVIIPQAGFGLGLGEVRALSFDPDVSDNRAEDSPTVVPGPGALALAGPVFVAAESARSVTVLVLRWGNAIGAVSVAYATGPGAATPGVDFTSVSGTLNFADGQTSAEFTIPLADDLESECNEDISLRLFDVTGGASLLPGGSNGVVSIGDNDLRLTGSVQGVSVTESDSAVTGNGSSSEAVVSEDGRLVAFISLANDLRSGVTQLGQVYVRDLDTGLTTLASVNRDGTDGGGGTSSEPSFNRNGRYVVFAYNSIDLVGDEFTTNTAFGGQRNIYRRDLPAGVTELVSVSRIHGGLVNAECYKPSVSSNGQVVAFLSVATDLVPQPVNGSAQLYVRDLAAGTTRLASVNRFGNRALLGSVFEYSLSADGRYVAFSSDAPDLVPGDTNGVIDVFVRDLLLGTTTLTSVNRSGAGGGNGPSDYPMLSPDGRRLVFTSYASDLVTEADTNDTSDVFLQDLVSGVTRLVSIDATGTGAGNSDSATPLKRALSEDGRYVLFDSSASNLVDGDSNGAYDVFVRDMTLGVTRAAMPRCGGGGLPAGESYSMGLSSDGRYVVAATGAPDVVPGEHSFNVLLRLDLVAKTADLINPNASLTGSAGGVVGASLSGDGQTIAFQDDFDTLLPEDENGVQDVFAWRPLPPGTVDLSLSQTDTPDPAATGAAVTYALTVVNRGLNPATAVVLTDILPAGATFLSAVASQGGCSNLGAVVTCHLGGLNVGALATVNIAARMAGPGLFTNAASVSATQPDPFSGNSLSFETTLVPGQADLGVTAVSMTNRVLLGRAVGFLVSLTNQGPETAQAARVTNAFTPGATVGPAVATQGTVGPVGPGEHWVWEPGPLPPHGSAELHLEATSTSAGLLTLTVNAFAVDLDLHPADNTATAAVQVIGLSRFKHSQAIYTGSESDGVLPVTILRLGETNTTASISFAVTPQTALAGFDFAPVFGLLVFAEGETAKSILVPLVNDSVPECREEFLVGIFSPGEGAVLEGPAVATAQIEDDATGLGSAYVLGVSVTATNPATTGDRATPLSFSPRPALSADGRYLAFASHAANLVPNDRLSSAPVLSGDGLVGAFLSYATNLGGMPDTNGTWDVFAWNPAGGGARLVSVNRFGTGAGNRGSFSPVVNTDGRFVAFDSEASDLVGDDTNGVLDVFVRDLASGTTRLASVSLVGRSGDGVSYGPVFSAAGRFVAFSSAAGNLVPDDHNGTSDVFVRDLVAGTTRLVSVNAAGTGSGNSASESPSLSADGRYVAFASLASDLVPQNTGSVWDVFVRDLVAGTTRLVSVRCDGMFAGNHVSWRPTLSADGRYVGFSSRATDLTSDAVVGGVDNQFRRDLLTGQTILCSRGHGGGGANSNRYVLPPALSADGRTVAFLSEASNLLPDDRNGQLDLFAWTEQPLPLALSAVTVNGLFYVTWLRPANDCTLLSTPRVNPPVVWTPESFTDFGLEKVHVRHIEPGQPTRFYRLRCP